MRFEFRIKAFPLFFSPLSLHIFLCSELFLFVIMHINCLLNIYTSLVFFGEAVGVQFQEGLCYLGVG